MAGSSENTGVKPTVFCVFCASSPGTNPIHLASARSLAHAMHASNIQLVYGGGTKGIMGELAKTLVSLSGPSAVHGVIPRALIRTEEGYDGTAIGHAGKSTAGGGHKEAEKMMSQKDIEAMDKRSGSSDLTGLVLSESEYGRTTIVPDMHTRKRLMASHVINGGPGSGFVALAGGYGTAEEVMEMVTWNQLGIHKCGIVLVNVDGYWNGLVEWVRRSVSEGFVGEGNKDILVVTEGVEEVVEALREYRVAEGRFRLDWGQG